MLKVSVVVATYNRASLIGRCMESLLTQTFSYYEIIVIDDGSTDGTKKVLKPFLGKIRYFYQKNAGVSKARNLGIQQAKGEYIAFTDDDVIVDSQWVAFLVKCFQENNCDVVGGRVLPLFPDETPLWVRNNPAKISGGVVIYDYGQGTVVFDPSHYRFIGANFAFRKQVLMECGTFREDLKYDGRISMGEDTEIVERMMKKNKVIYYCGSALVHHPVYIKRLTLRYAARWNMAFGRFSARQEQEENKHFIYWWGVPRYLWKGLIVDFLKLCTRVFHRPALYDACRGFFRKLGMVLEYRKMMRGS
ncbi:MAG: glycosyltransferase family 2 protein [Candidatus Omnitrophica bacterium]|nr:glycosyltransferase family 2 protein [Candidatus Omnitrophota bacterium]